MLSRIKTWLAAAGALVLAIAGAALAGRRRGRSEQKARDTQATARAQEVRRDVEIETSKLPDAPPQKVGTADPDTAAGALRDRWMRDRGSKG